MIIKKCAKAIRLADFQSTNNPLELVVIREGEGITRICCDDIRIFTKTRGVL